MRNLLLLFLIAFGTIAAADAQQRLPAADSAAAVPPVQYESAFATYHRYADQPLRSWIDLNEEVAGTGGHAGIFRGAGAHGAHSGAKAPAEAPLGQGQPAMRAAPTAPAGQHQR